MRKGFSFSWPHLKKDYAEGLLPAGFAWPAGLGDIFMAVTAPWIAARVVADNRFRFGRVFLVWNLIGIADFRGRRFLGDT
jgi:hypothetical protein